MALASLAAGSLILGLVYWINTSPQREAKKLEVAEINKMAVLSDFRKVLTQQLGGSFLKNQYPKEAQLTLNDKLQNVDIEYTFDSNLQKEADDILKSYRPDFGAIVIMNAVTGEILAVSSYEKKPVADENLALRSTYPAASVFKIVTATAALDKHNLTPDTLVLFNGANHTLYKRNVLSNQVNRWTREMTLREAFARSVNTFFGRLTLEKLSPLDIEEYAIRFGFNQAVKSDLPFDPGFTEVPKEMNFHLAEIATGFNRITRMSPMQGAMIAASVASNGVMKVPYIVKNIRSHETHEVIFSAEPMTAAVTMSGQGAQKLKVLMEETVFKGTSRASFGPLTKDRRFSELELGGKTGSLYGDNPRGKTDWFVGYAIAGVDSKLAIAAVTVHKERWTVKSSHLAQHLFKKHYRNLFSKNNEKFFQASHVKAVQE